MPGNLKTFDPKDTQVIIGGVIMGGFADGTFITIERDEDAYNFITGADGEPVRVRTNNKSTTLTLTLLQTSDSNDILSGFAILDEKTNTGVVPVLVKDSGGTTVVASGRGWIQKMANVEYSKEVTNREWVMRLAESESFVGGSSSIDLV